MKETFGSILKSTRVAAGLTQKDVARQIGCHPQYVSNVERGKCLLPYKKLPLLLTVLPLSEEDIITSILKQEREKLERAFCTLKGRRPRMVSFEKA